MYLFIFLIIFFSWLAENQHVDFFAFSSLPSALPQDHPQGHQTLQPAAGGRRSRQDRRLRCEQRVRGDGRPPVKHGGDAGLHGPRDDDRTWAQLQRKGETKLPLLVTWNMHSGNHWITYVLDVANPIRLCLIVRNYQGIGSKRLLRASQWWHSPDNYCVCLPGIRRVGDGSHTLLFCLWEGTVSEFTAKYMQNKEPATF